METPVPNNLVQLRHLLAEKFPQVRLYSGPDRLEGGEGEEVIKTGVANVDALLEGGLRPGMLTELISGEPSAGSALVMGMVLREAQRRNQWAALVDGRDSFDPGWDAEGMSHLLWVRCLEAEQAMRAAELIVSDGNVPLVLLDLRMNPLKQLRRISAAAWYRLQRFIEHKSMTMLVSTPVTMVTSARWKLSLQRRFSLEALDRLGEEELSSEVGAELVLRRWQVQDGRAEAG